MSSMEVQFTEAGSVAKAIERSLAYNSNALAVVILSTQNFCNFDLLLKLIANNKSYHEKDTGQALPVSFLKEKLQREGDREYL